YSCKKENAGHMARDCPNKARSSHQYPRVMSVNDIRIALNDDSPQFHTRIHDYEVSILIDSGAQGNFISDSLIHKFPDHRTKADPMTLHYANGTRYLSTIQAKDLPISVEGYEDRITFRAAYLPNHDLILGRP